MEVELLQEDVAILLGTSLDTVTNWENDHYEPQMKFRPLIISFLGYNPFEMDQNSFGGKLHAWRTLNGVTTKELAKRLSVNKSTVQDWEQNRRLPHQGMLRRVQELLE
jgi:DNA-binding transcriptional regulator YiaG